MQSPKLLGGPGVQSCQPSSFCFVALPSLGLCLCLHGLRCLTMYLSAKYLDGEETKGQSYVFLSSTCPRSCSYHFAFTSIGQILVTGAHLAAREANVDVFTTVVYEII